MEYAGVMPSGSCFYQNLIILCSQEQWRDLGFRKEGAKFSLATSAHTKEGANQVFQFFFNVKKIFSAMAQCPP